MFCEEFILTDLWEVLNIVGMGNGTSGKPELFVRLGFSVLVGANGSTRHVKGISIMH